MAGRSSAKQAERLSDRLRAAIEDSGLTSYALAVLTDGRVNEETIRRFRLRTRDLTLDLASEIWAALGIPPFAWPRSWPAKPKRRARTAP